MSIGGLFAPFFFLIESSFQSGNSLLEWWRRFEMLSSWMDLLTLFVCDSAPGIPSGVSTGRLSGFAEAPDFVFPSKFSPPHC